MPSLIRRYALALLFVAAALSCSLLLQRFFPHPFLFLFFAAVMALPIVFLLVGSFNVSPPGQPPVYGFANWVRAFAEPQTLSALWMSFAFSVVRLIPSLALSVTFAWLIARTDMPGGNTVEFLCWLTFFVPDFPLTLA